MTTVQTYSPIDGRVVAETNWSDLREAREVMTRGRTAQTRWRQVTPEDRRRLCTAFVDALVAERDAAAREITLQMGRPLSQSPGELRGFEERARTMIELSDLALRDIIPRPQDGFTRFIRRQPHGLVFCLAPWNYPYLTAVNSVVPALLAGNSVVLKHSDQTPLVAERFREAFERADLPSDVFQTLHCSHDTVAELVGEGLSDFVAFTGSVTGGAAVHSAARQKFIGLGLELGGKDPAYVRADADLNSAIENLVDGAFFNSGQSCCAIERIYVHDSLYERFVEGFVSLTAAYRLGDPLEAGTNLGPVVRTRAADFVRQQIAEAVERGATTHIPSGTFSAEREGSPYLGPQVLTGVDHTMSVMREESFGPVVGIMSVESDEEAIRMMNDSQFGLTASVWTRDLEAALSLGAEVETGTWFMNRCDYLDPSLAWTGVKQSGRGATLSTVGFESLTRPMSFHLRHSE